MYLPEHFRESRAVVLRTLIRRHPLAILIASVNGALGAEHLPLQLIDPAEGPWRLRGHLARANPLWRALPDGSAVLAVFRGADHYVSPTDYADRACNSRDVPTWNYAAIHVSGTIRFIHDPAGLLEIVGALTAEHEHNRQPVWTLADLTDADRATLRDALSAEGLIEEALDELVREPGHGPQSPAPADARKP